MYENIFFGSDGDGVVELRMWIENLTQVLRVLYTPEHASVVAPNFPYGPAVKLGLCDAHVLRAGKNLRRGVCGVVSSG